MLKWSVHMVFVKNGLQTVTRRQHVNFASGSVYKKGPFLCLVPTNRTMKIHVQDESHSSSRQYLIHVTQACLIKYRVLGLCATPNTWTYMIIKEKLPFLRHEKQGYWYNIWTPRSYPENSWDKIWPVPIFCCHGTRFKILSSCQHLMFRVRNQVWGFLWSKEFPAILGLYSSLTFW